MLSGVIKKIAVKVGFKWLTGKVRAAAEGKLGPKAYKIYWSLAGNKTWIGGLVGTASAVLAVLGQVDVATGVLAVGAVLFQLGLLDKAWRTNVPLELQGKAWYRFLVTHSADWAALFLIVLGILSNQTDFDASIAIKVLMGLSAVLVQLGILEPGWRSEPPDVKS